MCVTMPGEGGVSEGRELIRCVRMGGGCLGAGGVPGQKLCGEEKVGFH